MAAPSPGTGRVLGWARVPVLTPIPAVFHCPCPLGWPSLGHPLSQCCGICPRYGGFSWDS